MKTYELIIRETRENSRDTLLDTRVIMVSDLSDQQLSLLERSKVLSDFESTAQEINHYRQQIQRLENRLRTIISSYLDQHGRLKLDPVENLTFADEEMLEVYKENGEYFVKTMVNFNAEAWKYTLSDCHITVADLLSIGDRVAKQLNLSGV